MADTITVSVKLFATLKRYLPAGSADGITLTLPAGATVQDAIDVLKIPRDHAGMLVAGDTYVQAETPLTDGQQLSVFPPLAGGAW
jgi:molybdopterin converting factor small subunit